jgi:hypothetical protein
VIMQVRLRLIRYMRLSIIRIHLHLNVFITCVQ